jgi:hypothetical protein
LSTATAAARALVKPGELNLMTAGSGVAHSEVSTTDTTRLHGVQLWIALPDAARDIDRAFAHHVPKPIAVGGSVIRVLLGTLAGHSSPVRTHSPLVGAEITLGPTCALDLEVDATFEQGVLVDRGAVEMDGTELNRAELGYRPPGSSHLRLFNPAAEPARVMLIGGEPFTEPLLMWWNFVGRSHDEIVQFRDECKRDRTASERSRVTRAGCDACPRRRCQAFVSSPASRLPARAIPAHGADGLQPSRRCRPRRIRCSWHAARAEWARSSRSMSRPSFRLFGPGSASSSPTSESRSAARLVSADGN